MEGEPVRFSNGNIESLKITLLIENLAYQKANAELICGLVSNAGGKDLSEIQKFHEELTARHYEKILERLYTDFGDLPDFLQKKT